MPSHDTSRFIVFSAGQISSQAALLCVESGNVQLARLMDPDKMLSSFTVVQYIRELYAFNNIFKVGGDVWLEGRGEEDTIQTFRTTLFGLFYLGEGGIK